MFRHVGNWCKIVRFASAFFCFCVATPLAFATTAPAPGVEMPAHVRDFVARNQVTLDTPGAWRDKARRAREAREAAMRAGGGGIAAATIGGVLQGTLSVPVVVVGYANVAVPAGTAADLQKELFSGPWPTMTMTEYYDEISYENLDMTGTVISGGNLPSNDTVYEGGVNGMGNNGIIATFISDAVGLVDATTDFGLYDNDGPDDVPNSGDDDGVVDFIAFVHPEQGAECGGGAAANIWSHRWSYASASFFATGTAVTLATNDARFGGGFIQINDYVVQPALGCGGGLIEIGVFCHEFGHALGLPDLYDTDKNAPDKSKGLARWCLMAAGNWNLPTSPAHMCAWSKAELGWIIPTPVASAMGGAVIPRSETAPFALQINLVGSSEYFLIENRQPFGADVNLAGSGLAIYHVDNSETNNTFQNCGAFIQSAGRHYKIALKQADGLCDLEGNVDNGDAGDLFPGSTNNQTFNALSNPSSKTNGGVNLGVAVTNISASGPVMTANITPAAPSVPTPGLNVDMVFLFDVSGSMYDDLPTILPQIPGMVTALTAAFGSVRFGVASFSDFPFFPFGDIGFGDYAYAINQPLTANGATFLSAVSALTVLYGGDLPESQYEALFQLLTGSGRDLDGNNVPGDSTGEIAPSPMNWDPARLPIIFLFTDASFHNSDVEAYPGTALPAVGRTAVHNELTNPTVLSRTPAVFVLNSNPAGPIITPNPGGEGPAVPSSVLDEQAAALVDLTGGRVLSTGPGSADFSDAVLSTIPTIMSFPSANVPTVSTWGLVLLTLALMVGAKLCFRRTGAGHERA